MNLTTTLMQSEWTKALGWTFVHSLWQIALIGLLLYMLLRLVPGRKAHTRYTISTLALWLIIIMALSTFMIMLPESTNVKEVTGKLLLVTTAEPLSLGERISAWLEIRMPMMLTVWSVGVAILMFRLIVSLAWVRHMRHEAIPDADLQSALNQIINRLKLKVKSGAAGSTRVASPVTIGHLRPLILFPVGIINQLSPKEVEAILTHELAHIVRRDYLSNMVQSFIETLFYYHPITWWISAIVRSERENRADDLAVSWCGDQLGYAKALMTVQEMQVQQGPSLAIGFASRKGAMLARVQRILNLPYKNHNQMEKTVLLSLTSLCFLAFTLTSHTTTTTPPAPEDGLVPHTTFLEAKTDSIPTKGIYRIHKKTDDQDIQIEMEDGDIKELTIDGKEISPAEFEAYGAVIEELFGAMEAAPAMEGFNFMIPAIPAIPMIPDMPYMIDGLEFPEMPEMPEIPMIPDFSFNYFFDENVAKLFSDSSTITINNPTIKGRGKNFELLGDTMWMNGSSKIIIHHGKDSTTINADQIAMPWPEYAPYIFLNGDILINEEELQIQREAGRAQAEHWREQKQEYRDQWRNHAEQLRAQQEQMRGMERNQYRWTDDQQYTIDLELNRLDEMEGLYGISKHRLSLSDEMVKDGLVQPGTEVEVQLTPGKLKINGEKMPEAIHQKYLELYEQQQGVELSGNSRVEFTTKSKQRM